MVATLAGMPVGDIRTITFMSNELLMVFDHCDNSCRGAKVSHLPGPFGNVLQGRSQTPYISQNTAPHDKNYSVPSDQRAKPGRPCNRSIHQLKTLRHFPTAHLPAFVGNSGSIQLILINSLPLTSLFVACLLTICYLSILKHPNILQYS